MPQPVAFRALAVRIRGDRPGGRLERRYDERLVPAEVVAQVGHGFAEDVALLLRRQSCRFSLVLDLHAQRLASVVMAQAMRRATD
jgi:hypothetical protein